MSSLAILRCSGFFDSTRSDAWVLEVGRLGAPDGATVLWEGEADPEWIRSFRPDDYPVLTAGNGELTERARDLIEKLGGEIAGPEEAREILGLVA